MENEKTYYINLLFAALDNFNNNPDAVDNFKSYLEYHFDAWREKFAATPEGFIDELYHFSNIK